MEKRILVLDDDPGILEAIDLSLTYSGFKVRLLLSGDNVVRMIYDFEPDLIIIDYKLNGRTGGEICLELKSDPGMRNIPVIMLSADSEAAKRNSEFGCDSFLPKPFDLNVLVKEIQGYIDIQPRIIR